MAQFFIDGNDAAPSAPDADAAAEMAKTRAVLTEAAAWKNELRRPGASMRPFLWIASTQKQSAQRRTTTRLGKTGTLPRW
jgi:hypothetical protein